MPWNRLGNSDLLVSKAGIGTKMWGGQVSERTCSDMMTVAYEEFAVNFIVKGTLPPFILFAFWWFLFFIISESINKICT
jgi:hypothetical protein